MTIEREQSSVEKFSNSRFAAFHYLIPFHQKLLKLFLDDFYVLFKLAE